MEIAHYTQSTRSRRPLARDERERRALLRALTRRGGPRLLLFNLVDDHLHQVLSGRRVKVLARDLRRAIGAARPDLELDPPHVKPVSTRSYLRWLVEYLLDQPRKHDLAGVHPALWTGSCFQDLIGLRLLPGFDPARIRAELPRLRQRHLFPHVGLTPSLLAPADDDALHRAGAARIVRLAAATCAVGPELKGRSRPVVEARALAVNLAARVGLATREVAGYLGVGTRAVQKLARRDHAMSKAELALRRRLTLEDCIAGTSLGL
jgi:hypothetical protein